MLRDLCYSVFSVVPKKYLQVFFEPEDSSQTENVLQKYGQAAAQVLQHKFSVHHVSVT